MNELQQISLIVVIEINNWLEKNYLAARLGDEDYNGTGDSLLMGIMGGLTKGS